MKQVCSIIFCGLLLITQLTAFAQLQTGFHYKIKNRWNPANQTGYQILYSTTTVTGTGATSTPVPVQKNIYNPYTNKNPLGKAFLYLARRGRGVALKAGVKQKGDSLLLNFWTINAASDPVANNPAYVNSADNLGTHPGTAAGSTTKYQYYLPIREKLTLGTPSYYISLPYATWEAGLITIPFKYRFGHGSETAPNQLASAVNAGVYIGRKWGRTRFYADPTRVSTGWSFMLAAVGTPAVISVTSANTNKQVIDPSDEIGYSLGCAALGSYGSFTAGVVGGWDKPASEQAKKWVYANKFWLGFGVGYKLGSFGDK